MVSKWYEQNKKGNGAITPSKLFIGSPKTDADVMRNVSISGMLDKNGEDHFLRMNSQIKEFDNIRKQIYPHLEESADKKKPDNPKRELYSLKGSQFVSKLGDWAVQQQSK